MGVLTAENLSAGYRGTPVLEGLTLAARPGELTVLIGPNGAGKSTVLKTLSGALAPIRGRVTLEGRDLAGIPQRELARHLAAMLTHRPEPELMTCRELVSAGRYPYTGRLGILSRQDRAAAEKAMEQVGVTALRDRDFTRLSDGQRQRVLLARALCQEPEVLLLDEPTGYLDLRHKLEFLQLLRNLARQERLSVVLSLHDLDLAQKFADQVLALKDGRADRSGPPEQVFTPGYVEALYGIARGSYDPLTGAAEPAPNPGPPRVLALGPGTLDLCRRLWRRGIPFAAGLLPETSAEGRVLRALATVWVPDEAAARALLQTAETVLCPDPALPFRREAEQAGKLGVPEALSRIE